MALYNIFGEAAEDEVVKYLKKRGFKIIDQNWKTKWCEVDIIALKDKTMHFVEVKYRSSGSQGSGFDYITPKKLQKMNLAARSWVEMNSWEGEYVLSAAQVSGDSFEIDFIEEI
ncbi:MAG: YraN family protein [Candidatus Saccharimonadales bacterium]